MFHIMFHICCCIAAVVMSIPCGISSARVGITVGSVSISTVLLTRTFVGGGPNALGIPAMGIPGIGAFGASNIPGTGILMPDGIAVELVCSATMLDSLYIANRPTNCITRRFQPAKLQGVSVSVTVLLLLLRLEPDAPSRTRFLLILIHY